MSEITIIQPGGAGYLDMPSGDPMQNPASNFIATKKSERTKETYLDALYRALLVLGELPAADKLSKAMMVFTYPWQELTPVEIERLIPAIGTDPKYSDKSAYQSLVAIRGVMREAYKLKMIDADTHIGIGLIKYQVAKSQGTGRALSAEEQVGLIEVCQADENTLMGLRDATIFYVLLKLGLRRSEVIKLDVKDVKFKTNKIRIDGKGGKVVHLDLVEPLKTHLLKWLDARGRTTGALFPPFAPKHGTIRVGKRMSPQAIYAIVRRRAAQADIPTPQVHDFRRTFITVGTKAGIPIEIMRELARHENISTTASYQRFDDEDRREALEQIGQATA